MAAAAAVVVVVVVVVVLVCVGVWECVWLVVGGCVRMRPGVLCMAHLVALMLRWGGVYHGVGGVCGVLLWFQVMWLCLMSV